MKSIMRNWYMESILKEENNNMKEKIYGELLNEIYNTGIEKDIPVPKSFKGKIEWFLGRKKKTRRKNK